MIDATSCPLRFFETALSAERSIAIGFAIGLSRSSSISKLNASEKSIGAAPAVAAPVPVRAVLAVPPIADTVKSDPSLEAIWIVVPVTDAVKCSVFDDDASASSSAAANWAIVGSAANAAVVAV